MSLEKEMPIFRDLSELADVLGLSSVSPLYADIRDGNLTAYKLGKRYKVTQEEFDRFLAAREDIPEGYEIDELARSIQVTPHYLYGEIKEQRLKAYKVGKAYIIRPDDWQAYLESKKSHPEPAV